MPILNYTTQIDTAKTAGEIQVLLGLKGATSVSIQYADGEPCSVFFAIDVRGQLINFQLPSNWEGVLAVIRADRKIPYKWKTNEQAKRIAWRIVKNWVEAQLAIIESGQAELAEVFLPYAITLNGSTLFKKLSDSPRLLLGA